jgi:hypothetical protein
MMDDRGRVQFPDIVMSFILIVAIVVLSPTIMYFIEQATGELGAFSSVLFNLAMPLLILALIVSVAVSARGGGA